MAPASAWALPPTRECLMQFSPPTSCLAHSWLLKIVRVVSKKWKISLSAFQTHKQKFKKRAQWGTSPSEYSGQISPASSSVCWSPPLLVRQLFHFSLRLSFTSLLVVYVSSPTQLQRPSANVIRMFVTELQSHLNNP